MYSRILQQAMQAGRNLGQAGRNYGSIARDRGMDLLRNNPEYVGAAGLTGAIGGGIASQMLKDNDSFDDQIQQELTRAYKLYENGEMTNDEFKYIEASLEELKKNKKELMSRNATFGFAPTNNEGVAKGQPRYKLIVMQDKLNPFMKDLPSSNRMMPEDFR
tara:strand:- start:249 stop:731 length:483 start_codon:yes stop_codon:yes gene_type:complete